MHPIRKYCIRKGLSQKAFAKIADLHPQEVSNFINGIKLPGKTAAQKITKATGGEIIFRDLRPDLVELLDTPGNGGGGAEPRTSFFKRIFAGRTAPPAEGAGKEA